MADPTDGYDSTEIKDFRYFVEEDDQSFLVFEKMNGGLVKVPFVVPDTLPPDIDVTATVKDVLSKDNYFTSHEQPSGQIEWDWLKKPPGTLLNNIFTPSSRRRFSRWGSHYGTIVQDEGGPGAVFDRTIYPAGTVLDNDLKVWEDGVVVTIPEGTEITEDLFKDGGLVAQNLTVSIDFDTETVDSIAAYVSFKNLVEVKPGYFQNAPGHSSRAVLIVSAGGATPSLAVDSVQAMITEQSFGFFYYSAANIAAGGAGQVFLNEAGDVIDGETTWASLGLPNLTADGIHRYPFSMHMVDREQGIVCVEFPQIGPLYFKNVILGQIWHDRGTALSYQWVRHEGCGDVIYRGFGRGVTPNSVTPIELSPESPSNLQLGGPASPLDAVECPCPVWVPEGELEWLIKASPGVIATSTRAAIGPNQWSTGSKTLSCMWVKGLGSLTVNQQTLCVAFSNDGSTVVELIGPPVVYNPALYYHVYYHPGSGTRMGANGSADSPCRMDVYTSPDRITLTPLFTVWGNPGEGGIPMQKAYDVVDGALTTPPPIVVGGRSTSQREAFPGTISVAQLFAKGGKGVSVGPISGYRLVAGRDYTGGWTATYNIISTASLPDDPDGTHRTELTLSGPLKSAFNKGQRVTVAGVANVGATAANGTWTANPGSAPNKVTIPVNTTAVGAGGTITIPYPKAATKDEAGNRWKRTGRAVILPDMTAIPDASIPVAKLAGLTSSTIEVAYDSKQVDLVQALTQNAWTVLAGAPSITLPNDGKIYRVDAEFAACTITSANTITRLAIYQTSGTPNPVRVRWASITTSLAVGGGPINAHHIVGAGQTLTLAAYVAVSGQTLTVKGDNPVGGTYGPIELVAYRVS